jgi:hypothetical protein
MNFPVNEDPNEMVELCLGECGVCAFGEEGVEHAMVTRAQYNRILQEYTERRSGKHQSKLDDRLREKIKQVQAQDPDAVPQWLKEAIASLDAELNRTHSDNSGPGMKR